VKFVELAARTSFSFLRGASHPDEMIERAHAIGLDGVAVCDRDGLYGLARAHVKARELSQPFYVGAEVPISLSEWELRAGYAAGKPLSELQCRQLTRAAKPSVLRKRLQVEDAFPCVLFLVKSHHGYQNLCWLLTRAHQGLAKGECLLDLDDLEGHGDGLVALVPTLVLPPGTRPSTNGSPGAGRSRPGLPRAGLDDVDAFPERILERLRDVFGERVYSLTYRRLNRADAARAAVANRRLHRFDIPVLASAWPTYHDKSRKRLSDVLSCIRLGTTLGEAKTRIAANGQAYLRNGEQMQRLFPDHLDWVARTLDVASELDFGLEKLHYHFPCQPPAGLSADDYLEQLSWQGAARRYPDGIPEKVRVQIETELGLIRGMEMAPYFLSTWEVVEIARERGILCQGRGSAANSAVCYALGITAVNPECSNLLFERFMSVERKEPPDIDVDFEHERREEVIQEIYRRYGRERSAMVSEVICYRRKSALRDAAKVFGLSLEQTSRLTSSFSYWDPVGRKDATLGKRLSDAGLNDSARSMRGVLEMADALLGFPRHLSIHVGGFVLSSRPLYEVSPVEPARMEDRTVVPWDKDDLDILGFFKIDVLALGMLTAIRKALELAWSNGALRRPSAAPRSAMTPGSETPSAAILPEVFDPLEVITRIPDEDPAVYALTCRADTVGVFQIESRAQMAMLPRLRPRCFYDLVIEVAIVRPGPIQGGMVHPYLRRRSGEEAPTCHARLRSILERTLGVPLFQEQVMQIAIVGAGYSGGEADQLRRDMAAWKRTGRLLQHRARLLEGFSKNGIPRSFGEALFEQIKGFGEYGFPESHAASFGLLVYKSAWLKAHCPAHFLCALLNSQPMGFYSPASLVKDAQKHAVEVRPVCVVASDWDCTLEMIGAGTCSPDRAGPPPQGVAEVMDVQPRVPFAVRLGLRMVKGLAQKSAELLLQRRRALREGGQGFLDFADLVRQVPLPKLDVEALAEAGAFAALEGERRQVLWSARAPRQLGLFQDLRVVEPKVELPPLEALEVLALDYERVRLSIDDHPLRHLRAGLRRRGVLDTEELGRCVTGQKVRVGGLVTARQRPGTASGVVFVTLEDEVGVANLIFYSSVFEAHRSVAQHSPLLLVSGKVERHDPAPGSLDPNDPRQAQGVVAIVHLLVESAERLVLPGPRLKHSSRDFH
jgi:error-prone DNA polymerase